MALTLSIIAGSPSTAIGNGTCNFVASVTNSGATAVTLQSLQVSETSGGAVVDQPVYLTPNTPVGVGNPILLPSTTYYYGFQVVFVSPAIAGPSPQNAPGGAAPSNNAVTPDASFTLQLQSLSSDATVASASLTVPVLSTIAPFPFATGGAMQLSQGFNLVNLLTSFG
jgi:hypothetical protein